MTLKRGLFLVCVGLSWIQCHSRSTRGTVSRLLGGDNTYIPTELPTDAPTLYVTDAQIAGDLAVTVAVHKVNTVPTNIEDDYKVEIEFEDKTATTPLNVLMGSPDETEQRIEIHYNTPNHKHAKEHNGALTHENHQHKHPRPHREANVPADVHRASAYRPIKDVTRESIPVAFSSSNSFAQTNKPKQVLPSDAADQRNQESQNHHTNFQRSISNSNREHNEHAFDYQFSEPTRHSPNRYDSRQNPESYYSGRAQNSNQRVKHNEDHSNAPNNINNYPYAHSNYNHANTGAYRNANHGNTNYMSANYGNVNYGTRNYGYTNYNGIHGQIVHPQQSNIQQYRPSPVRPALPFGPNRLTNILPQASLLNNGFSIVQASPSLFHVGYPRSFAQALTRLN